MAGPDPVVAKQPSPGEQFRADLERHSSPQEGEERMEGYEGVRRGSLLERAIREERRADQAEAKLQEAREALAIVAQSILLDSELKVGRLRELLVKAGIDSPDRLSVLASLDSEEEGDG